MLLFGLLILSFSCLSFAWGPLSHMVFLQNAGLGEPVDFAAVDVPDGFFGFMSPAFSYATYAGEC